MPFRVAEDEVMLVAAFVIDVILAGEAEDEELELDDDEMDEELELEEPPAVVNDSVRPFMAYFLVVELYTWI